jgi:sugar phosphate permease
VRKIFYGWWVVFACFLIAFYVSGTVMFGFTAFLEPIAEEFGWSYTKVSFAASLRGLELGIFAPVMGFLVDRFGPRRLLFLGTLSIGLGFLSLSLTSTLGMFYGSFVLIGIGTSACMGTVLAPAVANWFRKDVGKALGIMSCGIGAGGILLPLITLLIDLYQWRTTFVILGFGIMLIGLPLSLIVRHRPEKYGYLPDGAVLEEQKGTTENQDKDIDLKTALRTRVFWHLSAAESIRIMTITALITHVIPYLSSLGISRSYATLVATSIPLLSIIGRLGFGWFGDVFNKFKVITMLYVLGGLSILTFAYANTTWLLFPFVILFSLSWGAPPLRGAILRENFGRLALGSILGVLGGVGTVARIIGPVLAGWTYDTFGHYQFVWFFFTGTFAIAVILMLTMSPPKIFSKENEEAIQT